MKTRFEGGSGRRLLIEALLWQRMIGHNEETAAAFVDKGQLTEYAAGEELAVQGGFDNDLFILVAGAVEIYVNGRAVATRREGETIGEMSLLSPYARRSATVKASSSTLALKISEPDFSEIASRHPQVWKFIAHTIADRLREREKFLQTPNPVPVLFVGSSVEGLAIAREIVHGLKHDNIVARAWSTPGVFNPGGVSIDMLLKEVDVSDFAAFVFAPDDKVASRGKKYLAPRDNIVFELGLFLGRLDRHTRLSY